MIYPEKFWHGLGYKDIVCHPIKVSVVGGTAGACIMNVKLRLCGREFVVKAVNSGPRADNVERLLGLDALSVACCRCLRARDLTK